MPHFLPLQRYLLPLIWTGLILLSVLSLARATYLTVLTTGSIDFHPYWYYGHFVRQGVNPYTAFEAERLLPEPARYVDGSEVAPAAVRQHQLAIIPANTASTLLISAIFSLFRWDVAKYIWFALNLLLLIVMPWLVLRLLPPALQLTSGLRWLAAFSFFAMKGPRVALANGQPSILIFFLMIITLLLRERHWLWAGLALGVALGKYSIALPVVLFLLFEKRLRLLAVAGLVQGASLLVVASLEDGSVGETLQIYWRMMTHFTGGGTGVHLGALLHDYASLLLIVTVVGTLVTLWFTLLSYRRGWLAADLLPVNSLLALWTLLGAYHRPYDLMLILFFLVISLAAMTTWQLPARQTELLGVGYVVMLCILCMPGEILGAILPAAEAERTIEWIDALVTMTLVAMWGVNLWLLPRVPRVDSCSYS